MTIEQQGVAVLLAQALQFVGERPVEGIPIAVAAAPDLGGIRRSAGQPCFPASTFSRPWSPSSRSARWFWRSSARVTLDTIVDAG